MVADGVAFVGRVGEAVLVAQVFISEYFPNTLSSPTPRSPRTGFPRIVTVFDYGVYYQDPAEELRWPTASLADERRCFSSQQPYQLGNSRSSLNAGRVFPEHPGGRFSWMLFTRKVLFFFVTWT